MIRAVLEGINRIIIAGSGIALVAASGVLSYSVLIRYFLKLPTVWEDETAVFLLVGAMFLSAAHVQDRRGHIGIEAVVELLSPGVNAIRRRLVDLASLVFCGFFAWKSWTLLGEAWVDGQVTDSTWGPPLWIPYSMMAAGMSLLVLQLGLQVIEGSRR